jgi:hypothetical protein
MIQTDLLTTEITESTEEQESKEPCPLRVLGEFTRDTEARRKINLGEFLTEVSERTGE